MSERRYPALRFVASVVKILALLTACGGIFELLTRSSGGLVVAIGLLLSGILTFAIGEAIYVLIDIEANTRNPQVPLPTGGSHLTAEQRPLLDD